MGFFTAHYEVLSSYLSTMLDCWKDSRCYYDSFFFMYRKAREEQKRNSMLISTCFAVRCLLHNQLSSRTHTTGLNLFFSAATVPGWWTAMLMFETILFLQPFKGRCSQPNDSFLFQHLEAGEGESVILCETHMLCSKMFFAQSIEQLDSHHRVELKKKFQPPPSLEGGLQF